VTGTTNTAEGNSASPKYFSSTQAFTSAVLCLLLGIAGGYFVRRARASQNPAPTPVAAISAPNDMPAMPPAQTAQMDQMKGIADTQAAIKLEQLKSDPNNVTLLNELGNIYYDSKQYLTSIEYYTRSLKIQPKDADVRTDMATAYWFTGDADTAIKEFNTALSYEPTKSNTLFNLGIVKWQGKHDAQGAVAAWQKLLDTHPNYDNKAKVLELIAQTKK
jgi:cytochrome c-type biogenesis protein CcmH/NrfG